MRIGWVGLGKLGLPCAMVLAQHYVVTGYDKSDLARQILAGEAPAPREEGFEGLRTRCWRLELAPSIRGVVAESEIIFVAVQTPHAPEYGGEQPAPFMRADFEYAFLVDAVREIARWAAADRRSVTIAVVSTVLPGTTQRLLEPLMNDYTRLAYTPAFIAMGTTIADYSNPEFVVCGTDDDDVARQVQRVFEPVHAETGTPDRTFICGIPEAEAIKVFYNTFISMKIVFANTVMEAGHKGGFDCDTVTRALCLGTDRVISSRYLQGGMGDGGPCHPRDLIALSWYAERLGLSFDLLGCLAMGREAQTEWLAGLVRQHSRISGLPVVILGKSYKPSSDLTYGSPALLLAHYLRDLGDVQHFDNRVDGRPAPATESAVYVIATRHPEYALLRYPPGSVVIDPWGFVEHQDGVTLIQVGRR